MIGDSLLSALHRSSEEIIESLRAQFRRRPFEVSGGFAWAHRRGATPQTEHALMRWRSRLFNNLAFAVFLLFLAVGLLLAVAVVAVLPESVLAAKWSVAKGLGLGAAGSVALSWLWMRWQMPRVFSKRPDARSGGRRHRVTRALRRSPGSAAPAGQALGRVSRRARASARSGVTGAPSKES